MRYGASTAWFTTFHRSRRQPLNGSSRVSTRKRGGPSGITAPRGTCEGGALLAAGLRGRDIALEFLDDPPGAVNVLQRFKKCRAVNRHCAVVALIESVVATE